MAASTAWPARAPLKTIGGWMILIAVIAVAAAVLRSARREPFVLIPLLIVSPPLLMTEIRAKWRRHRGRPMSGGERAVSVVQLTAGLLVLLIFTLKFIFPHL